jgi:glucose uptake protein GlcU
MAEVQAAITLNGLSICLPLCFGMKITALGIEFEAKINITLYSPSSLLPLS